MTIHDQTSNDDRPGVPTPTEGSEFGAGVFGILARDAEGVLKTVGFLTVIEPDVQADPPKPGVETWYTVKATGGNPAFRTFKDFQPSPGKDPQPLVFDWLQSDIASFIRDPVAFPRGAGNPTYIRWIHTVGLPADYVHPA